MSTEETHSLSPEYYGEMDFTIMFVEQNKLGFGDYGLDKKLKSSEYPRRWQKLQLENDKHIDLEGFFGYKNPILETSLAGIDSQVAKLRSRIELEDGGERGQQTDSLRVLKSSGRLFVLFNDSNLEIYEDNVRVYTEKNFFKIQHGTFLKNTSQLAAVEHAPFVILDYLYKNGTVISIFCKVKIKGAPALWIKYSFEIDINIDKVEGIAYVQELSPEPGKEQLEIRLAGTYNEGRILYQLQYFFSPIEQWKPKQVPDLRNILPGPAQYFEAKIVAFDVVEVGKIPVVFCLNLALESIQFVSLTELNHFNANNAVSVDFPVSEKDFENAQLSCRKVNSQEFICSLMVRYSPRSYLISIEIVDPWFESSLPVIRVIKPIYNLQGFFPLHSALSDDYLAVYNQNMDEMSFSTEYNGLHSVNTAKVHKPAEPQQSSSTAQPNPKLRTERSLIALYRLNSPSSLAWAILAQSTLQKLDGGEKLLAVFFAIDNKPRDQSHTKDRLSDVNGATTTLLVNSQLVGRSKLRRFTVQNMRIEIKEARKVHKNRGAETLFYLRGLREE